MVVLARVLLLVSDSRKESDPNDPRTVEGGSKSASPMLTTPTATTTAAAGRGGAQGASIRGIWNSGAQPGDAPTVEHGDIMRALSGAHLREVGIAVKNTRPGWQEAHVQLVSVLLVANFLEDSAINATPDGKRPDALR